MSTITAESNIDALDAVLEDCDDEVTFERKTDELLDLGDTLEPAECDRFYVLLKQHVARLQNQVDARRQMTDELSRRDVKRIEVASATPDKTGRTDWRASAFLLPDS